MKNGKKVAILGVGHIGTAIAKGLAASGRFSPDKVTLTRRKTELLNPLKEAGFKTTSDNRKAVADSEIIVLTVQPRQIDGLLEAIKDLLKPGKHLLISVVTGISVDQIRGITGEEIPVIRAMPNTAIAIRESMTCLASKYADEASFDLAKSIFDSVGKTFVIDEEQMIPATALCACGIAFFLRAIRAASQGGIEIGFHSEEALPMAAQTAKGAAALLLEMANHPEAEIDKVTTPKGCTISGINEMEHRGFSSAMIKGIITSAEKAACLYDKCE